MQGDRLNEGERADACPGGVFTVVGWWPVPIHFRRWEYIMELKQSAPPAAIRLPCASLFAKVSRDLWHARLTLLLVGLFAVLDVGAAESVQIPAVPAGLAGKALLTDSARLSDRVVAVGAYGDIVYSRDGKTWTQAKVPSQVLLTTVFFVDDREGWAAGHDALILHTTDGGENWTIQYEDPVPGGDLPKPILDIYFADKLHGWAVGAFSLLLTTEDGGAHWKTVSTSRLASQLEAADQESEPNFNALLPVDDGFIIVGELGTVLHFDPKSSTAGGAAAEDAEDADDTADPAPGNSPWRIIQSPYKGSFFGIKRLSSGDLFIYGLRGHLFKSSDRGATWTAIDTGGVTTNLNDIIELDGGNAIIVGSGGTLFRLPAGATTAQRIPYPGFNGFMSVQKAAPDALLLFGDAGAQVFQL